MTKPLGQLNCACGSSYLFWHGAVVSRASHFRSYCPAIAPLSTLKPQHGHDLHGQAKVVILCTKHILRLTKSVRNAFGLLLVSLAVRLAEKLYYPARKLSCQKTFANLPGLDAETQKHAMETLFLLLFARRSPYASASKAAIPQDPASSYRPPCTPINPNIYISVSVKLISLPRSSICDTRFSARLALLLLDLPALLLSPHATAAVPERHTAFSITH
jgi:hypothetical protein